MEHQDTFNNKSDIPQKSPASNYGPKAWNLQASGGLVAELASIGIRYTWMPQLGNPQKLDPEMAILRTQLADAETAWPIDLGLALLADKIKSASPEERFGILCSCGDYDKCHRKLVAETLFDRHFGGNLVIHCPR